MGKVHIWRALVVGGHESRNERYIFPKLQKYNIDIIAHWPRGEKTGRSWLSKHGDIPKTCDLVILLKGQVGHSQSGNIKTRVRQLQKQYRPIYMVDVEFKQTTWAKAFERAGVPLVPRPAVPEPVVVETPPPVVPAPAEAPPEAPEAPVAVPEPTIPAPEPVQAPPSEPATEVVPEPPPVRRVAKVSNDALARLLTGQYSTEFIHLAWRATMDEPIPQGQYFQRLDTELNTTGIVQGSLAQYALPMLFKRPEVAELLAPYVEVRPIHKRLTMVRRISNDLPTLPEGSPLTPTPVTVAPLADEDRIRALRSQITTGMADMEALLSMSDDLMKKMRAVLTELDAILP